MVGPRVYSVEEANALVPAFEASFTELDRLRELLRAAKIKLTALEMIWGSSVNTKTCPDHEEGLALLEQLKALEESFNTVLTSLAEQGAAVKDVELGLLDVYHVREGRLVQLCWKRGEPQFLSWHHVDAGYANRQPL